MNQFWIAQCPWNVAVCAAILLSGCSREHSHEADSAPAGEPKTAQATVWGEQHELFVEHRMVVAGTPAKFVTHVTDLRTQEPRRAGPVHFELAPATGTTLPHIEKAPARPGIYEPLLTFPEPGIWTVHVRIPDENGGALLALPGVKVFATQHEADQYDPPAPPEGVSFLKEQQWQILAKIEPAIRQRLVERLRLPAQVQAKPGLSATCVAPVSGQLLAPPGRAFPQPGERVEAGQVLALLQLNFSEAAGRMAEASAEFTTAQAALEQVEAAYKRTQQLAAEQAKSPRELQEAELARAAAEARFHAAAGLLSTFQQRGHAAAPSAPLQMELRAPIAGVLDRVAAGPGEAVAPSQPLFVVLNPETVWIQAHLPEASMARLGASKNALLESPLTRGTFTLITEEGRGRFVSVGWEVDAATRTVPILYETANASGELRIGQRVTLHIETARAEDAVAVPESALVDEGDQLIAFVQLSGETFEKRHIKTGLRDAGFVQVLDGLKPGDRVMTRGAYALRLSSISGVIPAHGHTH